MTKQQLRLECLRIAAIGNEARKESAAEILANATMFVDFVLMGTRKPRKR